MTDSFETLAVHAGVEPDPATGAVVAPIQMSTTFKQDAVGQTRAAATNTAARAIPTRTALEEAIAALEGATHGFAYASGLAATQNLLYLVEPGRADPAVGRRLRRDLAAGRQGLAPIRRRRRAGGPDRCGRGGRGARPSGPRRGRGMVWIETPTNPLLKIVDIGAVPSWRHGPAR